MSDATKTSTNVDSRKGLPEKYRYGPWSVRTAIGHALDMNTLLSVARSTSSMETRLLPV
jgi:hypothetical protein